MRNTRREFHAWVLENIYPKVCQKSSWQNVLDYTSLSVQGFWNAKCWRRKSLRQSRHCNGEVLRKSWGVNHGRMVGYWNPENYQLSTQRSPLLVPRPKKKERQVVPFWKSDITKLMWFSALRWINWSKVVHYSLALCRVTKPFFFPRFCLALCFFSGSKCPTHDFMILIFASSTPHGSLKDGPIFCWRRTECLWPRDCSRGNNMMRLEGQSQIYAMRLVGNGHLNQKLSESLERLCKLRGWLYSLGISDSSALETLIV